MNYTVKGKPSDEESIKEALAHLAVKVSWEQDESWFSLAFDDKVIKPVDVESALRKHDFKMIQEPPTYDRLYA